MKIGTRVEVRVGSFTGVHGRVTQVVPFIMVLLEGEAKPMRYGETELLRLADEQHIGGAE